jgi:signal peptidase I
VTPTGPVGPDARDADATAVLWAPPIEEPEPPALDGDEPVSKEPAKPRVRRAQRIAIEWVVLIIAALAIAFLIKTFLFQAFYIPSGSMEPTLHVGDRVLVNKLSYDFHDVNRGDVVVFEAPPSAQRGGIEDFVKRVVGLAGETITYDVDGSVLVNGRRLKEPYLPAGVRTGPLAKPVPEGCGQPPGGAPGCVVPAGRVFVLGDNREDSQDARAFGPIKESSIIGRVFVRIWPVDDIGFL